jgi:hypothetical protein
MLGGKIQNRPRRFRSLRLNCELASRASALSIVKDGMRAGEIISRIRLLFKKGTPQRESVDVNEIIREMLWLDAYYCDEDDPPGVRQRYRRGAAAAAGGPDLMMKSRRFIRLFDRLGIANAGVVGPEPILSQSGSQRVKSNSAWWLLRFMCLDFGG